MRLSLWYFSLLSSSFALPMRMMVAAVIIGGVLLSSSASAQRYATEQALDRFEEQLQPQVEEGNLSPQGIGPILVVGATSAYEKTRAWFPTAAVVSVIRVFGAGNVRACEACMNPTVRSDARRLEYNTVLSLGDVARLDRDQRGNGPPARSAIWMEETPSGVAVRIVRINNGQILFAGNFDAAQKERIRTSQVYNLSTELGRRLRGESLTHIFIDIGLVPNQHISADVTEQFGPYNLNMAGLSMSAVDPVLGLGLSYYRIIPLIWNLTLGAKVLVSIPTAIGQAIDPGSDALIDPLVEGVLVARFPIPQTNYAVLATASTNFKFTVGVTLLNVSILPFLP